jgi:SNF2 family DNA or RNA helicase
MEDGIKSLPSDYRDFGTHPEGVSLVNRIHDAVILLTKQHSKYIATLGADLRNGGASRFAAAPTVCHNWIAHEGRIRPLPADIGESVASLIGQSSPDDLSFPDILRLSREHVEGLRVVVDDCVYEKANAAALNKNIEGGIPGLKATLYPYQLHGVAWMQETLNATGGLILADEMGLGKTMQIIALFLLTPPSHTKPALIVCPTTLIANWCRELETFAPSVTCLVHRGGNRTGYYKDLMRSQVVITTYDTLANDITLFQGIEWTYMVCDEAQAAKNPTSDRRRTLAMVPRRFTIPVTGTPVENSLMDLWSLLDLAIPGVLGAKETFAQLYPDTDAGARELARVSDALVLKRQVRDVADDLPERTDVDMPVEMDTAGATEYESIRENTIAQYGVAGSLVAVGQLSLFSAHPWLRIRDAEDSDWEERVELQENPAYPLLTPKMELCMVLLREAFINKRKVLIFATYNHCGGLIKRAARELKLPQVYWNAVNGSTPQQDRQEIVDEFTKCEGPAVLVLNPRAAGAGLNITAATIVIHYTQNWNPAMEMQASARAHRRGQKNPVTIYRLYYKGTVEETMVDRSEWKRGLGTLAVPVSSREQADLSRALAISPAKTK